MEEEKRKHRKKVDRSVLDSFSPISSTRIDWKPRRRSSASGRNIKPELTGDTPNETPPTKQEESPVIVEDTNMSDSGEAPPALSERRKALFEPLEPTDRRISSESLLPPPDFDEASYPKGWLIGKKRKLVNVDVVESMRRIAVQEMNRKDREIGGLNEQLEEDSRCLEHLQMQLLDEKAKNANLTRENGMLREQINMLMEMLHEEDETVGDEGPNEP